MASRFFRGESESEDESSGSSSGDEQVQQVPTRFARAAESSDDEEHTVKRVAKSAQTKIVEEYQSIFNSVQTKAKNNEWTAVQGDLDKLDKLLKKSQQQKAGDIPRAYAKCLVAIEDVIKASETAEKKKMSGPDAKALTKLKQNIKKHNLPYKQNIDDYRAKPDVEKEATSDADESDDESSEEDVKTTATTKADDAPKPKYGKGFFTKRDESSDESSDDDDMDDDDDDSSSGDDKGKDRASIWHKKDTGAAPLKPAATAKRPAKPKPVKPVAAAPVEENEVDDWQPAARGKREKVNVKEMKAEDVDKKLVEILAGRGKRGTDRMEQIDQLDALSAAAKTEGQLTTILMNLVSAQFDATPSVATHMPANLWKGALANLQRILNILTKNTSLVLTEVEPDEVTAAGEAELVVGNLLAFVERLDDEFIKGLQNIDDPHTNEYVQRLQDEQGFLDLAESVQTYYERVKNFRSAARIASRRLEHLYYKHDRDIHTLSGKKTGSESDKPEEAPVSNGNSGYKLQTPHNDVIYNLCKMIYSNGDERLRARTMLMHIYHSGLHDRFYEARDLMLMSHLQESIHQMDIPMQILFNRTMVQLGLCAFRSNLIWEAHASLSEICGGGRVKELLAQGVTNQRFQDKNQDQEKQEKKRQVPFHMHISLELLECVHLISAMLLEVPNMAANPFDAKKRIISRTFRKLMDYFDRQVFTGPPENNRDFVVAAAKALAAGNWKTTESLLMSLKVWALIPNADTVKANLKKRIQEEGLRTYLYNFGNYYDSISMSSLSSMFELEPAHVHSLVSKLMINDELKASWDQPTGTIIMHRSEPTKLQYLAQQFAEKAANFVENNERLLDTKTGGYGYSKYDQGNKQQGQQQGGQQGRQDRGQWQDNQHRQQYGGGQYQRRQYNNNRDGGNRNKSGGDREQSSNYGGFQTVSGGRRSHDYRPRNN